MVGLHSTKSYADAYGVVPLPPYDGHHLLIELHQNSEITDVDVHEVTFDEADIQGTFAVTGHPGVIGLWLAASTTSPVADPTAIDPTGYVVTDLRPADNGYMFGRGEVWPPWDGATRPISREHSYP